MAFCIEKFINWNMTQPGTTWKKLAMFLIVMVVWYTAIYIDIYRLRLIHMKIKVRMSAYNRIEQDGERESKGKFKCVCLISFLLFYCDRNYSRKNGGRAIARSIIISPKALKMNRSL